MNEKLMFMVVLATSFLFYPLIPSITYETELKSLETEIQHSILDLGGVNVYPIFFSDGNAKRGWQLNPVEIDFNKTVDIIGFSCDQCAVMSWRTELAVSLSETSLATKEGMKSVVWSAGLTSYNPSKDIFFPVPLEVDRLFIHYFSTVDGDCAWNLAIYEDST